MSSTLRLFTRENLFAVGFFVILAGLSWLLISILSPFFADFLWALILTITFYPLYSGLQGWLRGRATLAAIIMTVLVLLMLILPGFFVLTNLGQEAKRAYDTLSSTRWEEKSQWAMDKLEALSAKEFPGELGKLTEHAIEIIKNNVMGTLKDIPKIIFDSVSGVLKNLAVFGLHIFFVAVALFFFFRDGGRYASLIIELLPLEQRHQEQISATISKTVSAVVRGMVVTALAQGLLAGVGFAIAGISVPVLLGVLTFTNSFIPFLGATSVWAPAAIWLFFFEDRYLAGIGLAVYGFFVISLVDNFLKPMIIGEGTKIPVFLLFFGILGGLKIFGVIGIFLGPFALSLGAAFLAIYREVYLWAAHERESQKDSPPAPSESVPQSRG